MTNFSVYRIHKGVLPVGEAVESAVESSEEKPGEGFTMVLQAKGRWKRGYYAGKNGIQHGTVAYADPGFIPRSDQDGGKAVPQG